MRLGICCSIENAPRALEVGFDYVELGASMFRGLEADHSENPFGGLPVPATNLFFDHRLRLNGPNRTPIGDYIRRTVERAALAGVKVLVIGSGGVRKTERETPPSAGLEAFLRAAEMTQLIANQFGIQVAPESLNYKETNVGLDLPEFIKDLASVGVGYTLDTYHVLVQEEGNEIDWRVQVPTLPVHVHLGGLKRDVPKPDDPALIASAARLYELGYDSRISYEGSATPADYPTVLATMKSLYRN